MKITKTKIVATTAVVAALLGLAFRYRKQIKSLIASVKSIGK
jgi:hypothetical protein